MNEKEMKTKKRGMIIDAACGVVLAASAALSFVNGDIWMGYVMAGLSALDLVIGAVAYTRLKKCRAIA